MFSCNFKTLNLKKYYQIPYLFRRIKNSRDLTRILWFLSLFLSPFSRSNSFRRFIAFFRNLYFFMQTIASYPDSGCFPYRTDSSIWEFISISLFASPLKTGKTNVSLNKKDNEPIFSYSLDTSLNYSVWVNKNILVCKKYNDKPFKYLKPKCSNFGG